MKFNEQYERTEFLAFLDGFLPDDFVEKEEDIVIGKPRHKEITKTQILGESKSLELVVLEMEHDSENDPRVTLATDAFKILADHWVQHALVIFKSRNSDNYRLSYLTVSLDLNEKNKVVRKYSNARRYSYVLGPKAKVNTPTKYLITKGKIIDLNDLKERFSLEVVNKDFYREISHLFIKLVGGTFGSSRSKKEYRPLLRLPSVPEKDQINSEFAVRLIGRVIFCWFLREKKSTADESLMPKELLSLQGTEKYSDYYHSVLEPIFFEVLNKHVKSRKDAFAIGSFASIPYLNGGLFSPDYDDYFSYNEGKQAVFQNTVIIPDEWIKEFFAFLETYNFTIDENVSFDEELSIDPEMLGRIFENLLAEINPETGESARKSTGSYYTPRVIVDYMVDESLFVYLKDKTQIDDSKLRAVISYDLEDNILHPLTDEEYGKIIDSLSAIRIIDPACGSGAFPIGALQKIVFILQQVDPDGRKWFEKQMVNTAPEIKRVIEREFANKNFNYIRKLGVIRENIFGVDIQPIATEISRLRCFLTLIVDESIHDELENRGIEPLPNLDFKFVTANTLIELPGAKEQTLFKDQERIEQLRELRTQFFSSTNSERQRLQLEFKELQNQMLDRMIETKGSDEITRTLSTWNPFNHKVTEWFDPEWMFGIESFDVVIGNPPYLKERGNKEKFVTVHASPLGKKYKKGKMDFWYYFLHRGIDLLSSNGAIAFITPSYWTQGEGSARLVEHIQSALTFRAVVNIGDLKVFEAVAGHHMVAIYQKSTNPNQTFVYKKLVDSLEDLNSPTDTLHVAVKEVNNKIVFQTGQILFEGDVSELSSDHKLGTYYKVSQGVVEGTDRVGRKHTTLVKEPVGSGIFVLKEQELAKLGLNDFENKFVKKYIDSSDVLKYGLRYSHKYLLYVTKENCENIDEYKNLEQHLRKFKAITDLRRETINGSNKWFQLQWPRVASYFDNPKIVFKGMFKEPQFYLDEDGYYFGMSMLSILPMNAEYSLELLLGILNSKFAESWFNRNGKKRGVGVDIGVAKLREFPLPNLSENETREIAKRIETSVREVIWMKKEGANSERLENDIDELVKNLYKEI